MAKQVINTGSVANDGTGDPLRTAFEKTNSNFDELYAAQELLEVKTNIEKQSLTGLSEGQQVTVSDEGGRVEYYHGDAHAAPKFLYAVIGGVPFVFESLANLADGNRAGYYNSDEDLYIYIIGDFWTLSDEVDYSNFPSTDLTSEQCWLVDWSAVNSPRVGSIEKLLPLHPMRMAYFGNAAEFYPVTHAEILNGKLSVDIYDSINQSTIDIYWDGTKWLAWYDGDSEEFSESFDDTEFAWLASSWSDDYRGSMEEITAPLVTAHEPNWSDIVPTYEVTVINEGIYAGNYTLNGVEVSAYTTQTVGWMRAGKHQQVKAYAGAYILLGAIDGAATEWSQLVDTIGLTGSLQLPVLPKVRAISINSNEG